MARLRDESVREEATTSSDAREATSLISGRKTTRIAATIIHADVEDHELSEKRLSKEKDIKKVAENSIRSIKKRVLLTTKRQDNSLFKPFEDLKSKRTPASAMLGAIPTLLPDKKASLDTTAGVTEVISPTKASCADSRVPRVRPRGAKQAEIIVQEINPLSESDAVSDDTDNMSDFIVHDSCESEEETSVFSSPLPIVSRSTRKLVRGRRPERQLDTSDDEAISQKSPSKTTQEPFRQRQEVLHDEIDTRELEASIAILSFSPPEAKSRKPLKDTRFATPPPSPTKPKNRLASPKKAPPRIPSTPHHPHHDDFWQIDVVNEWNDEYSPHKPLSSLSPEKLNSKASPLKSSPLKKSKAEIEAKKSFAARKHELATLFLQELDEKITQNKIAELSASTGGTKIVWSKTLLTTAGRANWKRVAIATRDKTIAPAYHHHATIELAEKVIDDEERLLNVVAHEFCHLANFMVSNIKTQPHGASFQAWGAKCTKAFGHRGVIVTTKHNYEIEYKYVWTCVNEWCGQEFKRQSKSIDPARHACGSCKSKLIQTKPVPRTKQSRNAAGGASLSAYQLFVKENMGIIRKESPSKSQKEIMTEVGRRYQVEKSQKATDQAFDKVESVETVVEDELDAVSRRLNFVDLTTD